MHADLCNIVLHLAGPCPTLDDSLVCRGKGLFSIIPVPDDATTHSHDDDEDEVIVLRFVILQQLFLCKTG